METHKQLNSTQASPPPATAAPPPAAAAVDPGNGPLLSKLALSSCTDETASSSEVPPGVYTPGRTPTYR